MRRVTLLRGGPLGRCTHPKDLVASITYALNRRVTRRHVLGRCMTVLYVLQALKASTAGSRTHRLVVKAAGEKRPVMIGLAADSGESCPPDTLAFELLLCYKCPKD